MYFEPFLRSTNMQLQAFLLRHAPGPDRPAGIPAEELRELRRWVQEVVSQTGGTVTLRHHKDEPEIANYIHHLQQLVPLLETVLQRLLAKRQKLDEERSRMIRAKAWASAYRSTI